jgi:ABC-type lipoprotein release transport system permease subunit
LTSLLYDIKPSDPLTFLAVTGALSAVTLLATLVPARRAVKLDPMSAIRHE